MPRNKGLTLPSRRAVWLAAQAIISISLVSWLLSKFQISRALHVVAEARPLLIIVGFVAAASLILVLSVRFSAVLRKGRLPLQWSQVLSIIWIGQFWNFFLPGSTGGDIYRVGTLWAKYPTRKTDALLAVFVDRLIPTGILAAAATIGGFFIPLGELRSLLVPRQIPRAAYYLIVAAALSAAASFAIPSISSWLRLKFHTIFARLDATREFWLPDMALARIFVWASFGNLLNIVVFFLYARAVGLPVSFLQVCIFLPLVLLLLTLPVSINGHGVREVILVAMFSSFGVVPSHGSLPETVIALSVVGLSSDLLLGLVGAGIFVGLKIKQRNTLPSVDE
jgi:uncharacterized membrane protein YbhN (UPF0104 family)